MRTHHNNRASVLYPLAAELGESPVWHSVRRSCFWVDINGKKLYEFDWKKKTLRCHQLEQYVSLVVPGRDGDVFLGLQGGVARFNPDSGDLAWITDLGIDWTHHRCNDGACDVKGRLWVGTMEMNDKEGASDVYCIESNAPVRKKIENVTISNGMAWSAGNDRLYYIDSPTRGIRSFIYEEGSGDIVFEKVAIEIPQAMGFPDGMTMDEEGMLWVALWGGFGVSRWDVLTGKMIDYIRVPAPHVSSCTFAGEDLDHLVITTATKGMNEEQLKEYPESGHVFIIKPGVRGLPRFSCSL